MSFCWFPEREGNLFHESHWSLGLRLEHLAKYLLFFFFDHSFSVNISHMLVAVIKGLTNGLNERLAEMAK